MFTITDDIFFDSANIFKCNVVNLPLPWPTVPLVAWMQDIVD